MGKWGSNSGCETEMGKMGLYMDNSTINHFAENTAGKL